MGARSPAGQAATPDRAANGRHRLGRPTALARHLRHDPTEAEKLLWRHLRRSQRAGFKFSRQLPVAGFIGDFVCRSARLIVEADGGQHGWQAEADAVRARALEAAGYRVIRFWNTDILGNIEGVLHEIERVLRAGAHPPTPSPRREGEHATNPPLSRAGGNRGVGTRSPAGQAVAIDQSVTPPLPCAGGDRGVSTRSRPDRSRRERP